MRITTLVIVGGSVTHVSMESALTFETVQGLVGGAIDTASSKEAVAWFGELAEFRNAERNYLAEEVGNRVGIRLDNVYGPVVLTGAWNKAGVETSVPMWIQEAAIEVSELILI